ncbi:MarR family transcriptional regulator, partial [Streptomyces sp. SID7982]|nr:MarR family transcriptional regulator [Streptomyces sp. SID7982]
METETATRWLSDAEQCAWRTHLDVSRLLTHQLEKDL